MEFVYRHKVQLSQTVYALRILWLLGNFLRPVYGDCAVSNCGPKFVYRSCITWCGSPSQ